MNAKTTSTESTKSTKTSARKRNIRRGAAAALALATFASVPSPAHAAFPGTNGKIVFVSERDGNPEIYVMNADGSGQKNLTNNGAIDYHPAWSPDGKQIAFSSDRDGAGGWASEIYVMNADGTGVKRLTTSQSLDVTPDWSPKGQIVFSTLRHDDDYSDLMDFEVYVMNPGGTGQTRITDDTNVKADRDVEPTISPDGTMLARTTTYASSGVLVGNFPLPSGWTPTDGPGDEDVNWSPKAPTGPNYREIAFESYRDGKAEIYTSQANGPAAPETNLTKRPLSHETDPAYSPDALKLAFTSDRDGNPEIYTMNADGTAQTRRTNNPAPDYSPDWQPVPVGSPACTIVGTAGNDTLFGTPLNDVICGLGGDDYIVGGSGNDILRGGAGNDTLTSGKGLDTLYGQDGNDNLYGAEDNDVLSGGNGDDKLEGGAGVDTLSPGAGTNTCKQDVGQLFVAC